MSAQEITFETLKRGAFVAAVETLKNHYGKPAAPRVTDPLQMILWENVAYLLPDEKREAAYKELKRKIGLSADAILAASKKDLLAVAKLGGMRPEDRVKKFQQIALIAKKEFPRGTKALLEGAGPAIKKKLKKFPGIGGPGADRIMLFSGVEANPTFDSNGLRVLARLQVIREQKDYSGTYRLALAVAKSEAPEDDAFSFYIDSFQLLRRHGQELCKTKSPSCNQCPLSKRCNFHAEETP